MQRNRCRAVTSKQALMADHNSLSSPSENHPQPISSFFGSPKFFKVHTSILDSKPFSVFSNQPFGYSKSLSKLPTNFSGNKHSWEKLDPKGIGLALIDSLNDEKPDTDFSQPNSRMILFGSKLKIQIPRIPPSAFSPTESQKSPADFGIKTPNSQLMGSLSPYGSVDSGTQTKESPQAFTGSLSASEMELSEDYTCVISHGPNPRTTHIYDNSIVESCCGVVGLSELKKDYCSMSENSKLSGGEVPQLLFHLQEES